MQIGYARVSTTEQNLEAQISHLKAAGCQRIYTEKRSGLNSQRPELDKMLASLREGDTVTVTRLNRLGRSLIHTLKLIENFKQQSIHFKSLDLGIDTTTPTGKLIMHVFAALAQYERETMLEQTKAGIEQARAKGIHMGRPKGYNAERLEKIAHLTKKNLSTKEIAELLNCSIRTITRYKKIAQDLKILIKENKILQQNIFGSVDLIGN